MALKNTVIATGRGEDTPSLPIVNPNGMTFRNGDASVAVTTVVKTPTGDSVTINNLPAGGTTHWIKVVEVVSTTATDYEIYAWD